MKQKPGWVLPDLKEAQKRTTNTIDRIDTFNIPEAARMMGRGKKYFISTYGCQANAVSYTHLTLPTILRV